MVKTLNRGEIMKKVIIYSIYSICLVLAIAVLVMYSVNNNRMEQSNEIIDYDYVMDIFSNATQSVTNETEAKIIRPYTDTKVSIVKDFYDYQADEKEQQNAIVYYEGTYMQNTGICYSSGTNFDVISVLSGEVTEVVEDELVGNSITIKHDENTYSVYQSIKDLNFKEGDHVDQGDKIGTSSTSNMNKDLNNHLYFELIINGVSVNPEEYYDAAL